MTLLTSNNEYQVKTKSLLGRFLKKIDFFTSAKVVALFDLFLLMLVLIQAIFMMKIQ